MQIEETHITKLAASSSMLNDQTNLKKVLHLSDPAFLRDVRRGQSGSNSTLEWQGGLCGRRQKKFDVFAFEETLISSAMLDAHKVQQPTGCQVNKCASIWCTFWWLRPPHSGSSFRYSFHFILPLSKQLCARQENRSRPRSVFKRGKEVNSGLNGTETKEIWKRWVRGFVITRHCRL